MKWIEKFESAINWAVLFLMALIVLTLTVGLAMDLVRALGGFRSGSVGNDQMFGIFSDLLLILIGLELMHTVKVYQQDHSVHIDVILAVALVAVARKVIAINLKDYPAGVIVGLAALILALAGGRWLVLRRAGVSKD